MSTTVLYTPEVLGLAVRLAAYPWDEALPLKGDARSQSCGSTISLGLAMDDHGRIAGLGIRSQACAIGQAAAAIFAGGAEGLAAEDVRKASEAIALWLSSTGERLDWPGLETIAAARDYPARHGAVMLPWKAAMKALFAE